MATADLYTSNSSSLLDNKVASSFARRAFDGLNGWTLLLSALIVLLAAEQWRYRNRKGSAAGPAWTIPLMGAFLDSMHPTFEGYYRCAFYLSFFLKSY